MANLFDLSDELIERIFESSGVEASILYQLSASCRRLQQVCLAQYLRKTCGERPYESFHAMIPRKPQLDDPIAALNLCTTITSINRLTCTFPGDGGVGPSTMIAHFKRIQRAIKRLTSVKDVGFTFDHHEALNRQCTIEEIHASAQAFNDLLNACLERGCTSLDLQGLNHLPKIYRGKLVAPEDPNEGGLVSSFKSLFSRNVVNNEVGPEPSTDTTLATPNVLLGHTWKYKRTWPWPNRLKPHHVLSTTPIPPSKLSTLAISNTYNLVAPPFLQWTYLALHTAPITTLALENIKLHPNEWPVVAAVLSHAAPALKHLKLSRIRIGRKTLALFIDGFPLLETVSVDQLDFPPNLIIHGRINGPDHVEYKAPKDEYTFGYPRWTHLTQLRITKEWILPTLFVNTVLRMPVLQSVTIIISGMWTIGDVSLEQLAQHDAATRTMRIVLPRLDAVLSQRQPKPIVYLEMTIPQRITPWMSMSMQSLSWIPHSVTGVVLVVGGGDPLLMQYAGSANEEGKVAQRWFSHLFPNLQAVVMKAQELGNQKMEKMVEAFCKVGLVGELFQTLTYVEVNGRQWKGSVRNVPQAGDAAV